MCKINSDLPLAICRSIADTEKFILAMSILRYVALATYNFLFKIVMGEIILSVHLDETNLVNLLEPFN